MGRIEGAVPKREDVNRSGATEVANKKKVKKFRAVSAVKALARERIGAPPATKIVPNKKAGKAEKHKPTLGKLLAGE